MNFLVDPNDVVDFNRSDEELELFWLFCLVVAGKTAKTQARLLKGFLESLPVPRGITETDTPFERLSLAEWRGILFDRLKESRLGQFNRLYRAFTDSVHLPSLREVTLEQLEAVYGVGPKTARMFLMMSRPDQRFAALDTHVLKHLRANGYAAPSATPSAGPRYRALEEAFLELADKSGMPVAEYDLMVWKRYSGKEAINEG